MDIKFLVKLTSRTWALDILALMYAGVPGRQAALLAKSQAGRTAFAQSLQHVQDLGLVARNPGHGHPLRPEFRLTDMGKIYGAVAARALTAAAQADEPALLRKTWTLPVLVVSGTPQYFSQIKRALPPITDRALSQSIKQMIARSWLRRDVDLGAYPVRPQYMVAAAGAEIRAASLAAMAAR